MRVRRRTVRVEAREFFVSGMSLWFELRTLGLLRWLCRQAENPHPSGGCRKPCSRNSAQRLKMVKGSSVQPVIIWVTLVMRKCATSVCM